MKTLDSYVLRETFRPFAMTLFPALIVLLIERMLRVLDLVLGAKGPLKLLVQMLAYLVPHYIGLALPFGLFLGVLLGFHRLSRDSELDAVQAAGIGVHRLMRSVMMTAFLVAGVSALTFSYLQPYGRYAYRAMVYTISNAFITAILNEGVITQIGDTTFLAEESFADGEEFLNVFLFQEDAGGDWSVMTARQGKIERGGFDRPPAIWLYDGIRMGAKGAQEAQRREGALSGGILRFEALRTDMDTGGDAILKPRGQDERELTLIELWQMRDSPPEGVGSSDLIAEFHGRLVRILSVLALPLLAVPLAHGARKRARSYGIGLGVVILVVYKEVLDFGENYVESEEFGPIIGLWLPFCVFVGGSGFVFVRGLLHLPKDNSFVVPRWLSRLGGMVRLAGGSR